MPGECPPVKRRHKARFAVLELDSQQLGKEMVEAIPLASIVERQEEEVRSRERGQQFAGAFLFDHRITQRAAQPFEDRGTKHQGLHRRVVCFEHLVDEEIDDIAVPAPEPAHERLTVLRLPGARALRGRARPASPRFARRDRSTYSGSSPSSRRSFRSTSASAGVKPSHPLAPRAAPRARGAPPTGAPARCAWRPRAGTSTGRGRRTTPRCRARCRS